jgi:16S rRNA (uracil1498-N3)-methyltransferase
MSRRRFFTPPPRRGQTELSGAEAEHLTRVLRVKPGQRFELSDNRNLYLAEVEVARKSLVSFRILGELPSPAPSARIILLPALFKFERFEWLIEKATELGVSAIRPWEAARSDAGLPRASEKRRARWEKIALEASQQSRRAHLPQIDGVARLSAALQTQATVRLALDENPDAPPILESLPAVREPSDSIVLLLGPEGGFTDSERALILAAGWQACSLGPTVLRAETAAIAGLAVVRVAWMGSAVMKD